MKLTLKKISDYLEWTGLGLTILCLILYGFRAEFAFKITSVWAIAFLLDSYFIDKADHIGEGR